MHLNNCEIYNNSETAIEAVNMSFTSNITNCDIEDNIMGIIYESSVSSNLNLTGNSILGTSTVGTGLLLDGGFHLNMINQACNKISNFIYGIYATYGTHIRLDQDGRNNLSGNIETVYLINSSIYLNQGFNQLHTINNDPVIQGLMPHSDCSIKPSYVNVSAHNNRWSSNQSATPVHNVHYNIQNSNCSWKQIYLQDNNPSFRICMSIIPIPLSNNSDLKVNFWHLEHFVNLAA